MNVDLASYELSDWSQILQLQVATVRVGFLTLTYFGRSITCHKILNREPQSYQFNLAIIRDRCGETAHEYTGRPQAEEGLGRLNSQWLDLGLLLAMTGGNSNVLHWENPEIR
jgi:hypothetical protein